jgi:hypothetical protein
VSAQDTPGVVPGEILYGDSPILPRTVSLVPLAGARYVGGISLDPPGELGPVTVPVAGPPATEETS